MTNEVKSNSSWNEYSKLVLKELETLASGIESLSSELKTLKEAIQRLELREDKVDELRAWKEKVDDVWSPPQMKDQIEKVQAQEVFKTRAITVFAVIQFLMASALFAQKFL
jgi:hypothetical protein